MLGDTFDRWLHVVTAGRTRREAAWLILRSTLGAGPMLVPFRLDVGDVSAKKHKKKCALAGQATSKKRKHCCTGLIKDSTGRCAEGFSPRCAETCAGCCDGAICRSGTSVTACGAGGALCEVCSGVKTTCSQGACICNLCANCDVCASGCAFTSVRAAINAAVPGDTIRICAGTYVGNVVIGKNLTLIGAGDGADPATDTILLGTGDYSVVVVSSGVVALKGLRVTGGFALSGGGINILTTATMTDCTVIDNEAAFGGGISLGNQAVLTLDHCRVTDNIAADRGGGIDSHGTLNLVNGSSVTGNRVTIMASFLGGGIDNSGTVFCSGESIVTGNIPDNCYDEPGGSGCATCPA